MGEYNYTANLQDARCITDMELEIFDLKRLTIQYNLNFYSAMIVNTEALLGRLWMAQWSVNCCSQQVSLELFFECSQSVWVDDVVR